MKCQTLETREGASAQDVQDRHKHVGSCRDVWTQIIDNTTGVQQQPEVYVCWSDTFDEQYNVHFSL